jgi:hypothetical protein
MNQTPSDLEDLEDLEEIARANSLRANSPRPSHRRIGSDAAFEEIRRAQCRLPRWQRQLRGYNSGQSKRKNAGDQ